MTLTHEEEFTAFVRATEARLLRAAYLICRDHHTGQDLLQDAYTKTASRWEQVRTGAPEAYVRRILYRDSVSRWRKFGREVPVDVVHDRDSMSRHATAEDATSWVDGADVRAALLQLPPRQRAVLVLRYYEDLSEQQIGEVLGIRAGTVKSQASRALASLKQFLPELAPLWAVEGNGDL